MNTTKTAANAEPRISQQGLWEGRLLVFESLPSTNKWAIERVDGRRHGDVIRAVRQTSGHGRFDRAWAAPDDTALTISVVLKDIMPAVDAPSLTQIAALAVVETLARYGIGALLKWPNDVLAGKKKISGILAEQATAQNVMILGIGLNVNTTRRQFEQTELKDLASSMFIVSGRVFDTAEVLTVLTEQLARLLDKAKREGRSFIAGYWDRRDALKNALVEINTGESVLQGKYAGMSEDGRIRIVDGSGKERLFWSGDVRDVQRETRNRQRSIKLHTGRAASLS